MEIRDYQPSDYDAVKQMHERQGIDFRMPDLENPLFLIKKVAVENGVVVACSVIHLEAEVMLWVDGSVRGKLEAAQAIMPVLEQEAYSKGFDVIGAFIESEIERRMGKRLPALGWNRSRGGWHHWTSDVTRYGSPIESLNQNSH